MRSRSVLEAAISLDEIRCNTGRPKGFVPYRPRDAWRQLTAGRILELYERMQAADALPLGPRQAGYRLKEEFGIDEYPKSRFRAVEDTVKRLVQAGKLPPRWVADASSVSRPVTGVRSA